MTRPAVLLLAGVVLRRSHGVWNRLLAREHRSQDICVAGTPAGTDLLRRDDSLLPWRWACVYKRASGEVSRVEHTTFMP